MFGVLVAVLTLALQPGEIAATGSSSTSFPPSAEREFERGAEVSVPAATKALLSALARSTDSAGTVAENTEVIWHGERDGAQAHIYIHIVSRSGV